MILPMVGNGVGKIGRGLLWHHFIQFDEREHWVENKTFSYTFANNGQVKETLDPLSFVVSSKSFCNCLKKLHLLTLGFDKDIYVVYINYMTDKALISWLVEIFKMLRCM